MKVWTVLFDIDGTIMTSAHAGTNAMAQTAKELFEVNEIAPLEVHGRCDRGILADLFDSLGVSYDRHHQRFCRRYYENLPASLEENKGRLLPGVQSLLEKLHAMDNVALGVLTGNLKKAAEIKLQHVGVDHFFKFGGYGDHFPDRNDVAAQAVESAKMTLNESFSKDQVWVLGDTLNDIRCARWVGAKVLAVETGGGTTDELCAADPDLLLPDLTDCRSWLNSMAQ